ncbi:MAG: TolB family protein [Ktedonobacteraceae bacterium]
MKKYTRKKYMPWHAFFLLVVLALSVQGCLGIGGNSNNSNQDFKSVTTSNGQNLQVNTSNSALFKGKIYFTQKRVLYVMDGSRNVRALTPNKFDVRDPSVSPDGKWLAFIVRYKYSSDLVYMPVNGTHWTILQTGSGKYEPNPPFDTPKSSAYWYAQPSWAADSTHLIFLSDRQKRLWFSATDQDAPLLDPMVFSTSRVDPDWRSDHSRDVAYADYGDGGDRDPSYRPGPGHNHNEIIYTHYTYDKSQTHQIIQLYLEDSTVIANHPYAGYHPGTAGSGFDPAIPLTPATNDLANMMPSWSPDGNSLAYIRRIDASHMGLYIMPVLDGLTSNPNDHNVQTKALQPYKKSSLILSGQYVSNPVWSPDGKQIAYLYYANNEFDIWIGNVSTDPKTGAYTMKGSPVPLTSGGVDGDSRPFWTA